MIRIRKNCKSNAKIGKFCFSANPIKRVKRQATDQETNTASFIFYKIPVSWVFTETWKYINKEIDIPVKDG